jgi:hypothetical protein
VKAEHVLLACLILVTITLAVSAILSIAFSLRLKRYERDVYLSLGSPLTPMLGPAAHRRRSAAILLFLKSKSHHSLRDERSVRLGDRMVLVNRILLGVIVLVCAATGYVILFVKL